MKQRKQKIEDSEAAHFQVAIFGSARIKMNDPRYKQIYSLAKMIAKEGMDIVTGGGPGMMEAASRGHHEGRKGNGIKVHTYGLNIKLPKEQMPNAHLDIKREFERFSERLDYFMYLSDVVVVASGGIGTLLELFYAWQLVQVKHVCDTPIILLGKQWPPLIKWMENYLLKSGFIDKKDLHIIFLAKNSSEAMKVIRKAHKMYLAGSKDFCTNYQKYKINNHD